MTEKPRKLHDPTDMSHSDYDPAKDPLSPFYESDEADTEQGPNPTDDTYKVGPGFPPKQYTWKKGCASPYPKGRPRKEPSMRPETRPDDKQLARTVVVMQRVHVDDLVGYLLEQDAGFEVLNLPAIAQSTATYDLGGGRTHTRETGDLLHPAHEPADVLLGIKKSMGSMLFSARYQQAPEPVGGKTIKRKMLQYYTEIERRSTDRIVLSWDIALSEIETGDYSAGVVLLNRGETYYVLEVLRGKFPFEKLKAKILDMKERHGKAALLIEKSPISHGLIQSIQEKRVNVIEITPDRDKRARLISQIDLFEGGSILLPKDAPWLDAFQAELLSFPGRHDDQVDALTQGLAWNREVWKPPPVQRTTVGLEGENASQMAGCRTTTQKPMNQFGYSDRSQNAVGNFRAQPARIKVSDPSQVRREAYRTPEPPSAFKRLPL